MGKVSGLIINGYSRFCISDGIHSFQHREPGGKIALIECETEQLQNGDIEFMTEHGITLSEERKRKYINRINWQKYRDAVGELRNKE